MKRSMDRVGAFLAEKTPRRALALATFVGLIVLFRGLLVLLVFFCAFESGLGAASTMLATRTGWPRPRALLVVLGALAVLLAGLAVWGASSLTAFVHAARAEWPHRLEELQQHPRVLELKEHLPDTETLVSSFSHYGTDAVHVLNALGHLVAYALIGLILAVVFLLEREAILRWRDSLPPASLLGTLARWFDHVAEAISVTVQLQLIVAAFNTLLTLPVLFVLGIPDKPLLMMLIFVSGLVPVIGNVVSGAVLSVMAWLTSGPVGVAVFLVLTFLLHKVEAYYLNPRLTARHVKLPGFVLILSLIAWEHVLGFAGLFVSFPFLFIAGKIRAELAREELEPQGATRAITTS